jgi:hypothetical protein
MIEGVHTMFTESAGEKQFVNYVIIIIIIILYYVLNKELN